MGQLYDKWRDAKKRARVRRVGDGGFDDALKRFDTAFDKAFAALTALREPLGYAHLLLRAPAPTLDLLSELSKACRAANSKAGACAQRLTTLEEATRSFRKVQLETYKRLTETPSMDRSYMGTKQVGVFDDAGNKIGTQSVPEERYLSDEVGAMLPILIHMAQALADASASPAEAAATWQRTAVLFEVRARPLAQGRSAPKLQSALSAARGLQGPLDRFRTSLKAALKAFPS